jgi:hypothetical protein
MTDDPEVFLDNKASEGLLPYLTSGGATSLSRSLGFLGCGGGSGFGLTAGGGTIPLTLGGFGVNKFPKHIVNLLL